MILIIFKNKDGNIQSGFQMKTNPQLSGDITVCRYTRSPIKYHESSFGDCLDIPFGDIIERINIDYLEK